MQSDNRLERRTLQSNHDDQVVKDPQNASKNDTLYNTVALGLMAAGGYGLYKTGALRPIMKPILEFADKIAREGTDKASATMRTVNEWSRLNPKSKAPRIGRLLLVTRRKKTYD